MKDWKCDSCNKDIEVLDNLCAGSDKDEYRS
jgi:hypothetical protein